ncbi:hypothetical protein IPA_01605 [Ignicoccus pacificus DSM 13166]|uniref:Uncharacterized protein n=1 Tax=Ignicoccus pacificus DSM 13166 TaxID=940294 RepID=A0A977KAJ0_9CREN|nr:hypothetical protein IPA_01605 [Ignicoccus pacificus DSM 13166]
MIEMGVIIRPLGSSSFRKPGNFSPQTRGSVTYSLSYPLPPPTTLAGALAQIVYQRDSSCKELDDKNFEILSDVKKCLEKLGVKRLTGAFAIFEEGEAKELTAFDGTPILGLRKLVKELERSGKKIEDLLKREVLIPSKSKNLFEVMKRPIPQIGATELTGIALHRTKKQTGIESSKGMIYIQERRYIAVQEGKKIIMGSIVADIYGDLRHEEKTILGFGGEGLPARLELSKKNLIEEELSHLWNGRNGGECLLLIATPLLFKEPLNVRSSSFAQLREKIEKLLKNEIKHFTPKEEDFLKSIVPPYRVEVDAFSLGWSLAKNRPRGFRHGIWKGLFYGNCDDWHKLYREGAGDLRELGFGTLVPIPI